MKDPGLRDWRIGVQRLLEAPLDLAMSGAPVWRYVQMPRPIRHVQLFEAYLGELNVVIPEAQGWWSGSLSKHQQRLGSLDEAMRLVWFNRPAGPASYPNVVGVVRRYWLACDALNREAAEVTQRVPPEIFLLQWLVEEEDMEAVRVLAGMPYWPVGLDAEGHWR
jgi:hypothetical protein